MPAADEPSAIEQSLGQPLLEDDQPAVEAVDSDQSDLHETVNIIESAKKVNQRRGFISPSQNDMVEGDLAEQQGLSGQSESISCLDNMLHYSKSFMGYALLGGRTLSCLYRFVLINETVRLLFKVPGLNRWEDVQGVIISADVVAAVLSLADMVQTIMKSKDSVLALCQNPNWTRNIPKFFSEVFRCYKSSNENAEETQELTHYPIDLLLSGLVVCFASGMKGTVGSQNVLHRLSQYEHFQDIEKLTPVSYFVGFSSSVCFLAFQWLGQGMWVKRAFDKLKKSDHYVNYLSRHKLWDWKIMAIGVMMGVAGALVGAIAACYVHHHFEFTSPVHMSLFFVALTAAYFNLIYSYNPIYRMELLMQLHNAAICTDCKNKAQSEAAPIIVVGVSSLENKDEDTSKCNISKNANAFFSSSISGLAAFGGSITFSPAIIRTLQIIFSLIGIAASDREKYDSMAQDSRFILSGMILSMPFVYFSMLQYVAVWGSRDTGKADIKPKAAEDNTNNASNNSDSATVVDSETRFAAGTYVN